MTRTSSSTDELNLLDLALFFWEKRLVLLLSTLVFFVGGVLAASLQTPSFRGEVRIYPQDGSNLTGFDTWNHLLVMVNAQTQVRPGTGDRTFQSFRITSNSLFKKFQSSYQRGDALNVALRQHSAAVRDFTGNETEIEALMGDLRRNFELREEEAGHLSITFDTRDKAESNQILLTMLNVISDRAKQEMLRSIRSKLASAKTSRQLALERNATEITSYSELYEARKNRTLTFMREQASVARQLGIDTPFSLNGTDSSLNIPNGLGSQKLAPFESNYFLQGYLAIEEQIANIQQRVAGDDGAMMNDVDPLILERARLQNYNAADVLTPYVDQIPLNEPEFRIVRADLAGTRYERQTSKLLLVVLFTSVGVLLTIIFLLAQLAIQQRDSDEKAA